LKHFAAPSFWFHYRQLPPEIQSLADKNFGLLKSEPRHPSLRFKKIGSSNLWSVRVGLHYRALAKEREEGFAWFWVGPHHDYERVLKG
jgi:hypothetical protein